MRAGPVDVADRIVEMLLALRFKIDLDSESNDDDVLAALNECQLVRVGKEHMWEFEASPTSKESGEYWEQHGWVGAPDPQTARRKVKAWLSEWFPPELYRHGRVQISATSAAEVVRKDCANWFELYPKSKPEGATTNG